MRKIVLTVAIRAIKRSFPKEEQFLLSLLRIPDACWCTTKPPFMVWTTFAVPSWHEVKSVAFFPGITSKIWWWQHRIWQFYPLKMLPGNNTCILKSNCPNSHSQKSLVSGGRGDETSFVWYHPQEPFQVFLKNKASGTMVALLTQLDSLQIMVQYDTLFD